MPPASTARRPSSAQPRRSLAPAPCIAKYPPRSHCNAPLPPQGDDGGVRVIWGRTPGLVFPPSGWRADTAEDPSVNCSLQREYVYGYNGACTNSVHFISSKECVYPVAALVVVHDFASNQQRYFEGHCNDVTCVGWSERRQLCASGQLDRKGSDGPVVYVWTPRRCSEIICEIGHPQHTRWINAVGFSLDGHTLVTFTGDDRNTLHIWRGFARWDGVDERARRGALAADKKLSVPIYTTSTGGYSIHSIFMSPDGTPDGRTILFHAVGKRHFKCWSISWPDGSDDSPPNVTSRMGTFGKSPVPKNPTCMAFAASDERLAGMGNAERGTAWMVADNGHFYVLMGPTATRDKRIVPPSSGVPLGCVAALPDGRWVAGGGDGALYFGRADPAPRVEEQVAFQELAGEEGQAFRSTAVPRFSSVSVRGMLALFGTSNHALILVDLERRAVLQVLQVSHPEEASALDHHPSLAIMASASVARDIRFWSTAERRPAVGKVFRAQQPVRCLAFSPRKGSLLAAGCDKGFLEAFAFPSMQPLFGAGLSRAGERISDVRFSDSGSLLGAACWDQNVYLLNVYRADGHGGAPELRMHRILHGNSSSPTCLMFSANGEYVMSNSKDAQILFWRTKDGSLLQSISAFRDTQWQSPWTCILGWPVIGIWGDPNYDSQDVKSCCESFEPNAGYLAIGDDMGHVKLFRFPSPYTEPPYKSYGGHSAFVTKVRFSRTNLLATMGGDDHSIALWSLDFSCQEPQWQRGSIRPQPPYHADDPPTERFGPIGREGRLGWPRAESLGSNARRPSTPAAAGQGAAAGRPASADLTSHAAGGGGQPAGQRTAADQPAGQRAAAVGGGQPPAGRGGGQRAAAGGRPVAGGGGSGQREAADVLMAMAPQASAADLPLQTEVEAQVARPGQGRSIWRARSTSAREPPPFAVEASAAPSRPSRSSSAAGQRRPPSPAAAASGSGELDGEYPRGFADRRWPGGQSSFYNRSQGVGQALRWD